MRQGVFADKLVGIGYLDYKIGGLQCLANKRVPGLRRDPMKTVIP